MPAQSLDCWFGYNGNQRIWQIRNDKTAGLVSAVKLSLVPPCNPETTDPDDQIYPWFGQSTFANPWIDYCVI